MSSTCTFDLNKSIPIYYGGETVAGTITLNTKSDKNVRDVSIIFLGEGKVKWQESHTTSNSGGSTSNSTTYYTSHETYINNSTCVHGDGQLRAGIHTFTFNIALPWECPTSCEGQFGHIRYEIILKINRYYRFDNVFKKAITVIRNVDLNLFPTFKLPLELENFSSLCCWPCSKGKIIYTLQVPFGAYAPGQKVNYTLYISNQSTTDCEGYEIVFTQKIIFTARSPHNKQRHLNKDLVSLSIPDKCLRYSNRIFQGELLIPATPPTTEESSIICVAYAFQLKVKLSGCHRNPKLKVPLVIGTIPIRESLPTNQLLYSNEQQQVAPTAPDLTKLENQEATNNLAPSYNDISPPTYEESIRSGSPFIDTDVDERNRIVGFQPLYPMYNTSYNTFA